MLRWSTFSYSRDYRWTLGIYMLCYSQFHQWWLIICIFSFIIVYSYVIILHYNLQKRSAVVNWHSLATPRRVAGQHNYIEWFLVPSSFQDSKCTLYWTGSIITGILVFSYVIDTCSQMLVSKTFKPLHGQMLDIMKKFLVGKDNLTIFSNWKTPEPLKPCP